MRARTAAARVVFVAGLVPALVLLAAGVASAAPTVPPVGGSTPPLSLADGLLIFGGVPLAVTVIVALLTLRPGATPKAARYRPGHAWEATPSWFGHTAPALVPGGEPVSDTDQPVLDATSPVLEDGGIMAGAHEENVRSADEPADPVAEDETVDTPDETDADEARPSAAPTLGAEPGGARGRW